MATKAQLTKEWNDMRRSGHLLPTFDRDGDIKHYETMGGYTKYKNKAAFIKKHLR